MEKAREKRPRIGDQENRISGGRLSGEQGIRREENRRAGDSEGRRRRTEGRRAKYEERRVKGIPLGINVDLLFREA